LLLLLTVRQQLEAPRRFGGTELFRLLVPGPRCRNVRGDTAYAEVFQFDRIVGLAKGQGSARVCAVSAARCSMSRAATRSSFITSSSPRFQAFPPGEARRLLHRLEFHYVPKHPSWLNMVEIEIGVLRSQCLDRRIDSKERLMSEITAWERQRNTSRAHIKWMFTTKKARAKMARAYPKLSTPGLGKSDFGQTAGACVA
jgi:DDE superfamily endonuclease